MTSEDVAIPPPIERGLRGARSVSGCVIDGSPRFAPSANRWVVSLFLRIERPDNFVDGVTKWCALLEEAYPLGSVSFYPATEEGLTVTFPHQERNEPDETGRGWRSGKLCLDSPFRGERRPTSANDPFVDAETRLRWHVERALDWLDAAAEGRLLAPGQPFELPQRPHNAPKDWEGRRIIHDETASESASWSDRGGTTGTARIGEVPGIGGALAVVTFEDKNGAAIHSWAGRRPAAMPQDLPAVWWLWPEPIVAPPWRSPGNWGDLRAAGRAQGVDVDAVLKELAPRLRGSKNQCLLLLGYRIPNRVGETPAEVHWDTILLPRLRATAGTPPSGFRPNMRGWWQRDRWTVFADDRELHYLETENWDRERLQARGRLPSPLRQARIAILGVGALGALLAEMLVRAGAESISLFDSETVVAGNVCRHVVTLLDVGTGKVHAVAKRLVQISPFVNVTEVGGQLAGNEQAVVATLEPYDVIVDCTASDDAMTVLAQGWWPTPRTFASFSMGFGGQRLFSFGVTGHQFPHDKFRTELAPWLRDEAIMWAGTEEVLEGAGCWSPLFPARYDDVVIAAAVSVKELDTFVARRPREPRFSVFEKRESNEGFVGFARREQTGGTS